MVISCTTKSNPEVLCIQELVEIKRSGNSYDYSKYCNNINEFELISDRVSSSFFGDYNSIVEYNRFLSDKSQSSTNIVPDFSVNEFKLIKSNLTTKQSFIFEKYYTPLGKAKKIECIFKNSTPIDAKKHIIEKSKDHHFTLINETHYSGKHRAFTSSLLDSLWENGYRYLALEGLGYNDKNLNYRKYPISESGYYISESNFGNLIRRALMLGYKLISYESKINKNGSCRDEEQAENIIKQTYKKDTLGKVLIHAGYSHISKDGDENYYPMGYYLEKITGLEILSIDQINMNSVGDSGFYNKYYNFIDEKYTLQNPTVLVDDSKKSIIDFVNSFGIDIQVYHPTTKFIGGRPDWVFGENSLKLSIPSELKNYNNHLFQIFPINENNTSIAVDQFILTKDISFIVLPHDGEFIVVISDCEGQVINLKINVKQANNQF